MKKHKNIIFFLVKFFLTYFILFAIYSFYLQKSQQEEGSFKTASITRAVAHQTIDVLTFFGYDAKTVQHKKELSMKLFVDDESTARVIEGCNSISIIILFIAFVVAFSGTLKATSLYILFGSCFIYSINVLRIALLTVLIHNYPNKVGFLHDVVFPAIIYGTVFLLWVIWVNKFSKFRR